LPDAWPKASPSGKRCAASLDEYRRCDPEPWVMVPREASGDGPVALPLDGQFQSCRL
jgi:hypothetical protein